LFPPAVAATAIHPVIAQPHLKELQIQPTREITITIVMHIVNAHHAAHRTMTGIARNADTLTSTRVGLERNIK